jgi:hypothetical protein
MFSREKKLAFNIVRYAKGCKGILWTSENPFKSLEPS